MNIFYIIHIILFLLLLSFIFFPLYILKYGLYTIPLIISLTWLIFDGCPIDKFHRNDTPNNIIYAEQILEIFPNSKFIHIIRDPRAVISSMLKTDWPIIDVIDSISELA